MPIPPDRLAEIVAVSDSDIDVSDAPEANARFFDKARLSGLETREEFGERERAIAIGMSRQPPTEAEIDLLYEQYIDGELWKALEAGTAQPGIPALAVTENVVRPSIMLHNIRLTDVELDRILYLLEVLHDQNAGAEIDLPLIAKLRVHKPRV